MKRIFGEAVNVDSLVRDCLPKMGISVNGSAPLPANLPTTMKDFFDLLKVVAVDYRKAFQKIEDNFHRMKLRDLYETQEKQKKAKKELSFKTEAT